MSFDAADQILGTLANAALGLLLLCVVARAWWATTRSDREDETAD